LFLHGAYEIAERIVTKDVWLFKKFYKKLRLRYRLNHKLVFNEKKIEKYMPNLKLIGIKVKY
jgi:hypothetical protein